MPHHVTFGGFSIGSNMLEKLQSYLYINFKLRHGKERMCDPENHIGCVIKVVLHELLIEEDLVRNIT